MTSVVNELSSVSHDCMAKEDETLELYGVFHSYVYEPDDSDGSGVVRVRVGPGEYVVCDSCKCALPLGLTYGTPLIMEGEYREGRSYNFPYNGELGFTFTSICPTTPHDIASAVTYVANLGVRGIADTMARKIVDVTGPDLVDYFNRNPSAEDLHDAIPMLKVAVADALIQKVMMTSTEKRLYDFMTGIAGVTYKHAFRVYKLISKELGRDCSYDEVLDALRPKRSVVMGSNANGCYYYCSKAGIPFEPMDLIAKELGYRAYHPERIRELTYHGMVQVANNGHTYTDLDSLYRVCNQIAEMSAFDEPISKWAIFAAVKVATWLFVERNNGARIYLGPSWFDECSVVENVRRIQATQKVLPFNKTIVSQVESEYGVKFSAAQRECFSFLENSGIHIVTGGAGTGKTTIISGLLAAYTRLNPDAHVALCAPTGRAAQRMTELCSKFGENVRAYTIHKLLDFEPYGDEPMPSYNEKNPLGADMLIVDEMSMVDSHLFALLMKAIKDGALIILCGDVNQLPSVGAGRVFGDLIDSGQFHVVRLIANYRQANGKNNIIENAVKINEGKRNLVYTPEFQLITCDSDIEMQDVVMDLISFNKDQTVLTTIRRGSAGVIALNRALQPVINPCGRNGLKINGTTFYVGDQILMVRNNYEVGYVNGDVGVVKEIDGNKMTVELGNGEHEIADKNLDDVMLAYAMTIHKSQGSEYDSVIIVLPSSAPGMLARNLLYTAVTRAKKQVTIVAQKGAVEMAIKNVRNTERKTTLKEMLTV